eukprot:TRINITY_DN1675_c0_g1_i1.p1 TRINITY_DN1675_c0_g1~~TRINITY_DN1675_c0_g1_i1.p1  ORF type:complete len:390 (+),score=110.42 TRINITY_DN1675_c0_g1_i1:445-1614(+)
MTVRRRIYVGSLSFDLTELNIRQAFSAFGEILSVTMSVDPATGHHKGFAFVEFTTADAAQMALACMNGFVLGGRALRVGPPNTNSLVSFQHPTPSDPVLAQQLMEEVVRNTAHIAGSGLAQMSGPVAGLATPAQSMKNWVYVGSIFWDLTEDDLRTVFSAIGPVRNCILPPNPETGKHKGHAFVEFEEEEHAEEAKRTIDGMELAGRNLRVGLCTSTWPLQYLASTKGGAVSMAAENVAARVGRGMSGMGGDKEESTSLAREESVSIRGQGMRNQLMQKLQRDSTPEKPTPSPLEPTRVVLLRNMVTAEEVDETLEDDITSECEKYGTIDTVRICKIDDETVRIFVAFTEVRSAVAAQLKLDRRFFAGRTVQATFYPIEKFMEGDYLAY